MNFASFIPLMGCICNLFLAIFVLSCNVRSRANRVYFFLGISIANWNLGSFYLFVVKDAPMALFWARELHFGLCFGIALFFHLSLIIAGIRFGKWIYSLYVIQGLLALSDLTPYFVKDVQYLGSAGWYAVAGPIYYLFAASFGLAFASLYILFRKRRQLGMLHRRRIDMMILAQSMLAVLGNNDILPIMGIVHYPFTNVNVYPYGSLAANFYGIMVAYSVLQHQLLDVHVAVSKIVAHGIRLGFLFLIGLSLLLGVTLFAPSQYNAVSFFSTLVILLLSGLIASVFFPRLFGSGGEGVEKRILGDKLEYQDQISSFINSMQWYTDTDLLMSDLHEMMTKTLKLRSYEIILFDETTRVFSLFHSHPERPQEQFPELRVDSPVFEFFQSTGAEYLAFNFLYSTRTTAHIEQAARESLKRFDAEFCFPFVWEDEPFGLMLIGSKTSGDPYTATDISLMVLLVKNLSLVINQIRLKNQIQHQQELELLGRMSRGMAHDLNNLLTPIWTLLQLVSEGVSTEDLTDELLPVALRNIKTMRAYVRESLFFSENLRPDFQLGRLDMQIAQAVDLTAARRAKKQINVVSDTPGEVLVEMDEVLIQRLIANIIANAIDASPEGSTIRVELVKLVKTEATRDWLRVRVVDRGEGIKKENLDRIFTPYFTTKDRGDRGDHERGFGLGLAICRKIVNLHSGNLNVFSQLGKGTTVQIDLPSRQVKQVTPAVIAQ